MCAESSANFSSAESAGRLPKVAVIGRPNVGKSSLFNRLTATPRRGAKLFSRSARAIVAATPGITRDFLIARATGGEFEVTDTGGIAGEEDSLSSIVAARAESAAAESDAIILVVDGRIGLHESDKIIAERIRRRWGKKPLWVAVNKTEGIPFAQAASEFHALGFAEIAAISALRGDGVEQLTDDIKNRLCRNAPEESPNLRKKIALVGRPNAGKSTIANLMLGADRMIVSAKPGTTRDSVHIDFDRRGAAYTLIDTAGIRRRLRRVIRPPKNHRPAKTTEDIERLAVAQAKIAIAEADAVIMVMDATEGVSFQDKQIAAAIDESGRAAVLLANKCDLLSALARRECRAQIARELSFAAWAKTHFVSAVAPRQFALSAVFQSVQKAMHAANRHFSTALVNQVLGEILARREPPRISSGKNRPRLRYAHQGGINPPLIIIHGAGLSAIAADYRRYLERAFANKLGVCGSPLRVAFRTDNRNARDRD